MKPGGGVIYPDEVKAQALAKVAEFGLAEAAKMTKIPKSTLHHWAQEADVPTVLDPEATRRTEKASQVSRMARRQRLQESEDRLTMQLAVIAELAARAEIEIIRSGKASLNEVVGARTRAIHDLQLLLGKATDRTELMDSTEDVVALRDELLRRLGA